MTVPPKPGPVLHQPAPHESGALHVTGEARYVDDLPEPVGLLHGAIVCSPAPRGKLLGVRADGIERVLVAADVPGDPWVGPVVHDEPVLAVDEVQYVGQPVALVLAGSPQEARRAAKRVTVEVEPRPALITLDEAVAAGAFHGEPHVIARGDVDGALASAALVVEGTVSTPAQDHFYLEPHAALAVADEHGITVWSSTQHPTEIQRMVAHVLGWPDARVSVVVPRLGGGFGGKESQATVFACLAAVGAVKTGRPVKIAVNRHDDMLITGKRHPFRTTYRAGFDAQGRFVAFEADVVSDGGWSLDLSLPIVDRCLFHLDNAYFLPAVRLRGRVARTAKASNTAFRGFGGPQGMVVVEDALERAAFRLGLDPVEIRRRNYYGAAPRDRTPYGQQVEDPRVVAMTTRLLQTSDYGTWRAEVDAYNQSSQHHKRGLGFVPVKFGISFTNALLNQAGALILVYADGSVQLNHGGTEMGQGLHTKMIAVCADVLGVRPDAVRIMHTSTEKVPNTSATAASSGSDLNGQAVREAAEVVRGRMAEVAGRMLGCDPGAVRFANGVVEGFGGAAGATTPHGEAVLSFGAPDAEPSPAGGKGDGGALPFGQLAKECWLQRVSLSATGFYRTPGIAYDRQAGSGTPFYYFAYGVALAEVELSGWTGEHRLRRIDVLHDVGDPLVPSIDRGQIEGALVQGIGWLTNEDVLYGPDGAVRTLGPSTYKVPATGDVPDALRVEILADAPQPGTIGGSKAVGEPPLMLGIAVYNALADAVRAFGGREPQLARPATPEALLEAIGRQR